MQGMAAASDEELLRGFAAGQASAFEQLYRRHELRVFRYLLRTLRNHALAEEALQETWFAVAREAPRYQPTARFTTWLFTIAHHRMIDALRARRATVAWEAVEQATPQALAIVGDDGSVAGPYAAALASEQWEAVLRALAALPEEQRQAFLLQQEADLSVEEIAEICACSFETAKSRLRYARSKLRELLQDSL